MRFQKQFRQSPHLDAKSPFCQDHSQQMFVMKTAWEDFTGSLSSMLQCLTVLIKNIFLKSHLNLLCWKASYFLSSSQIFTEQFITGLFIVTLYISESCYHVSCSLCSCRLNKLYHLILPSKVMFFKTAVILAPILWIICSLSIAS